MSIPLVPSLLRAHLAELAAEDSEAFSNLVSLAKENAA